MTHHLRFIVIFSIAQSKLIILAITCIMLLLNEIIRRGSRLIILKYKTEDIRLGLNSSAVQSQKTELEKVSNYCHLV